VPLSAVPTLLAIPPISLLLAACAGAILQRAHARRTGRAGGAGSTGGTGRAGGALLAIGLCGLVLLSLPLVAGWLTGLLEAGLPIAGADAGPTPQAIVILSADDQRVRVGGAIGWRVGRLTLEREAAGASLARRTHLPILVSGGVIAPGAPSLAAMMGVSLDQDFATPVRWREDQSLDTWQNAARTAALLRPQGVSRVYLVTHAWHMRRAMVAFRHAGLDVIPAPVQIDALPGFALSALMPSARAWEQSYYAMHELIGWAWYAIRA
jgi:uncharacterized SAM-binding protein YcdF (DUF218 family)